LIGFTDRRVVEFCCGTGWECMAANLIVNHGCVGLLVDASKARIEDARQFFGRCRETFFTPPTLVQVWITAENVNDLLCEHGFTGDVDLFALDMDGVDYWIWKALEAIRPRVVVLEYNRLWGPQVSVTVPYRPDFAMPRTSNIEEQYHSASLPAFVKLGREKGYRLVGIQRTGLNAFFLRADVAPDILPEVSPAQVFATPVQLCQAADRKWFLKANYLPWVEV
jgi:hypothetical protein